MTVVRRRARSPACSVAECWVSEAKRRGVLEGQSTMPRVLHRPINSITHNFCLSRHVADGTSDDIVIISI